MTRRTVTIRSQALADIDSAGHWYESQQRGLGFEFYTALAIEVERLGSVADQFPIYYKQYRRVLASRFPYKLFFTIANQEVILFRVLHTAQDHTRKLK